MLTKLIIKSSENTWTIEDEKNPLIIPQIGAKIVLKDIMLARVVDIEYNYNSGEVIVYVRDYTNAQ